MTRFVVALLFSLLASFASAQGTVAPTPRQQFFDNSGNPLAGGWVCVYAAGSSTLTTTYTTAALNVANSNPVVLDSSGRATIFLAPGASYKFTLESPTSPVDCSLGGVIWTVDRVSTVPTSNVSVEIDGVAGENVLAGEVVYLSDGSGSKNSGQWYLADADFTYASITPEIGLAVAAIAAGDTGSIRIQGSQTLSALNPGTTYYVSATPGALTSTAPTNNRFVGQAKSATELVLTPNPPPSAAVANASLAQGRCTLTTGVPVTTGDVTAATTVYYTPYEGYQISLFDGTRWNTKTFTELSIAVPATTATMYDLWAYDNSGVVALEALAWTNDTTRATALTTQNGVLVKTGALTRRYICSFRTTGVSGQTEDSAQNRLLYNYYNRVRRDLKRVETTASWAYTTATVRQANGAAANQVAVVNGFAENAVDLSLLTLVGNTNASIFVINGIGYDSTSAIDADVVGGGTFTDDATITAVTNLVRLNKVPAAGYHTFTWLEWSTAAGTTTWYGTAGGAVVMKYGLSGSTVQ